MKTRSARPFSDVQETPEEEELKPKPRSRSIRSKVKDQPADESPAEWSSESCETDNFSYPEEQHELQPEEYEKVPPVRIRPSTIQGEESSRNRLVFVLIALFFLVVAGVVAIYHPDVIAGVHPDMAPRATHAGKLDFDLEDCLRRSVLLKTSSKISSSFQESQ